MTVPRGARAAHGLVLACLSVLLVLGSAAPASAHATLVGTDPAEGAVLEAAPEEVTFTFDESVIGVPAGIRVFDARGDEVDSSASVRDGRLVVALDEAVGEGTLVVLWRLVSTDGHPIGGSLSFSVGAPSDVVDVPSTSEGSSTDAPLLLGGVRWLGYLGLLVAAGVAAFSVLLLPAGHRAAHERLRTTVRLTALVAVLAWWAAVPLVALYQLGLPASALGDGSTWSSLAVPEYVVPAAVTLGLALAAGAAGPLPVLLGAALAVAAPSLTGHTRAATPEALVVAVDVLHLAAGAVWVGGLVALALVLVELAEAKGDTAAVVLSRYSTWAAGILGVLVVAGSLLAWRIAGSWQALVDTGYGGFLLVKVLLVLVAVAFAAWNRLGLLPRLRDAARRRERRDTAGLLARTTVAEAGVLVAVLLVTGLLVDRSPEVGGGVAPAAVGSTSTQAVRLNGLVSRIEVDPLAVGPATVTITTTDAAGDPAEGYEPPRLSLSTDDVDLGEVALRNLGPGTYAGDVVLPTPGEWQVRVSLRITEFDNPVKTVAFVVP